MSLSVSVIIPSYNRADDVQRAVRSVLMQSQAPLEVLVVDDGSTDRTAEVVRAMPAPVRYLPKPNGGVSSARNLGMREARGDVVALLDSDDQWEDHWLRLAVAALEAHPEAAAVCANLKLLDEKGVLLSTSDFSASVVDGSIPLPHLFQRRFGLGSNLCVRRSLLPRIGEFDESLSTGEDIDFALRVAAVAPLRWLPEAPILITKTAGSLSARLNTGNRLRVFEKFERLHPDLARVHARALQEARANTALSYALDLTYARQLPEALARAAESWRQQPSWRAAAQIGKILLLKMFRRSRA